MNYEIICIVTSPSLYNRKHPSHWLVGTSTADDGDGLPLVGEYVEAAEGEIVDGTTDGPDGEYEGEFVLYTITVLLENAL